MQPTVRLIGVALAAAVAMAGCKGDGGTGPNASIALSLSKSASSIVQGGSDQVTATVTRTNFSGTVNITVEGAPSGVTGSVSNVSASGNTTTATVTIAVDVATAPGTYTLSVKAAGEPATPSTVSFALTVTAKPDFGLSLDPATLSIQAGGTGTSAVTITRTNLSDAITLTLTGAPTDVTGAFDPAAPTGNTSTLTIAVGASVAPGTYDLHVVGNASGIGDRSVALTLTVTAAPPVGSYTLSASPNPVSIQQGANGPVTITIARTNFTGDVALSLVGAPTGVTAAFNPATLSGSTATSTLTITVGSTVAAGNIGLTVTGTVAGRADVTVALTLTVTAAPAQGFSLSATQASIQAASNATSTVTITRTGGFSGTVHLTVQTAPSGVTGSFNPTDVSGTSSTLTLAVTGSVTAGNYTVTIKGSSSGQPDATFDIALTVTAPSGGSIHWDFSSCPFHPIWFAVQDGSGPWTQVVGVNFVFSFNMSSPTGAVAYTLNSGPGTTVVTLFLTLAEAQAGHNCVAASGKSITGTAAGLGATDNAQFSLGGSSANATAAGPLFTFQNVALGTFDLFGYRRDASSPGVGDKLLITRDLHTNSITTVGTQDFSGGSAIDPASANLTITGGTGAEQFQVGMNYYSGSACTKATFYNGLPDVATTQTMLGVPNANRRTNDWHQVTVSGFDGSSAFRSAMESFQTMGNRSVALPSNMPSTSPTAVAFAPYKRLHYVTTLPSDLRSLAGFHYQVQGGTHAVQVTASVGLLTGGTLDLTTPDWTTAAGFDPTWVPPASATVSWLAEAFGTAATACSNGARSVFASHLGTL